MSDKKSLFINRELSWLEFNQRVLEQAESKSVPLMDRLFFLTVTSSNMDEFYMVRVGGLELLREAKVRKRDPAGLTPVQQLNAIKLRVTRMVDDQYNLYHKSLLPELSAAGIILPSRESPYENEENRTDEIFRNQILPVLTPMPVEQDETPLILQNLELYIGVRLEGEEGNNEYAAVPISRSLERIYFAHASRSPETICYFVEDIVTSHIDALFPGRRVLEAQPFRITRNANMSIEDEFAEDLSKEMETILYQRRVSGCVRLEVDNKMSRSMILHLCQCLNVANSQVLNINGPLDLTGLRNLLGIEVQKQYTSSVWTPQPCADIDPNISMFEQISEHDILLSLPYDSFSPIIRLISEAADDPDVLAIKQILYRTSHDSPVIEALGRAAQNGKYVTTIVELKARFDEANNIAWAHKLEALGVQVVYGVKNLKTHGKICTVIRKEAEGIVRYSHFGTGNYNDKTAKLYTDVGLLTRDDKLGADASAFFNAICGRSQPKAYNLIAQSPFGIRNRLLELIEYEIARAKSGQKAMIMAKVNSLSDPTMIKALYKASSAGVEILLNVRGICCLRPGVKGLSENIKVVSIIDRFLEHSRIFLFHHGGNKNTYISSADWMPRNLDRRVELLIPVQDKKCQRKLINILKTCFADNVNSNIIQSDGTHKPVAAEKNKPLIRCQKVLYENAYNARDLMRRKKLTSFEPHKPSKKRKK